MGTPYMTNDQSNPPTCNAHLPPVVQRVATCTDFDGDGPGSSPVTDAACQLASGNPYMEFDPYLLLEPASLQRCEGTQCDVTAHSLIVPCVAV